MLVVNAKVHVNPVAKILQEHGLDDNGAVTRHLRDTVDRLSDPYVPRNGGDLARNKTYPNNYTIKYTMPYAHYMYKGELMLAKNGSSWAKKGEKKHYVGRSLKYQGAPKRGPNWDKRMMRDRGNEVVKALQNFINGGNK